MISLADQKESGEVSTALRVAWELGAAISRSMKGEPSDHLRFLLEVVAVCGLWLDGNSDEAVKRARDLDQVSRGVLGIEKVVSVKPF